MSSLGVRAGWEISGFVRLDRGDGAGWVTPVHRDERLTVAIVEVVRGFENGKHGRETDVAAFHDVAPLVPGLGLEDLGEFGL